MGSNANVVDLLVVLDDAPAAIEARALASLRAAQRVVRVDVEPSAMSDQPTTNNSGRKKKKRPTVAVVVDDAPHTAAIAAPSIFAPPPPPALVAAMSETVMRRPSADAKASPRLAKASSLRRHSGKE